MGGFDYVIGLIIVLSIVIGIWRGFIKESLSLVSWIMAFWLGALYREEAGNWLAQYVTLATETFRVWAGFTVVFIATLLVFALITVVVTQLFLHGPIKTLDRFLGIGFGGLRGVVIVLALMWVSRGFGLDESQWWKNSTGVAQLMPTLNWAESYLPEGLRHDDQVQDDRMTKLVKDAVVEQLPNELLPSEQVPNELEESNNVSTTD